jgi:hypothetical protein
LAAGKSVVITSGLLHAFQHKGIEDIVEARYTDHKVLAHEYSGGFGAGNGAVLDGGKNENILFPEIFFLTNDAWPVVRLLANGNGYPLLLMDRYSKGILYIWTMPENFSDLYLLPPGVTGAIKNYVMRGFPIRLDGPAQVALFAYDNHTFIVESYLPVETDVKVSLTGNFTRLKNLVTGEVIPGQAPTQGRGRWRDAEESRMSFNLHLPPHSYAVFAAEK